MNTYLVLNQEFTSLNVLLIIIFVFVTIGITLSFYATRESKKEANKLAEAYKLAEENSNTTVSIKADVDEISEGNFVAVITNSPVELSAEYIQQFKDNLTEQLRNDGEYVANIEVKYHSSKQKRSRTISQDVKDRVWNRDGGKCIECGSNENLEFDHIIPFSKGGANTYRNIQLLCEPCNRSKSDIIG
ncbi:HNH endonuclease [Flavobacteriaceae bacterium]|nr:HNH endonuclease [Flavobacteriaceae bacterium]